MKNISRRVFIKGMAVAAVATAASTVLTGCKLPVGTEETVVVPGFASETKTLTIGDESVTITTTGCGYKANGDLQVDLKIVNNVDADIALYADGLSTNGDNEFDVAVYFDGKYYNKGTVGVAGSNYVDIKKNDEKNGKSNVVNTYVTIAKANLPETWSTASLVFALQIKDADNKVQKAEAAFSLNK